MKNLFYPSKTLITSLGIFVVRNVLQLENVLIKMNFYYINIVKQKKEANSNQKQKDIKKKKKKNQKS